MSRESRSVFLLLALAVAGHAVRLLVHRTTQPPGELLAGTSLPVQDPARQHTRAVRAARPLGAGEQVDLNTAAAEEIARLPRIGMSLAKRIVKDRLAHGLFRGPGDLDRVPGIGPALLGQLADRLVFGGVEAVIPAGGPDDANTRTSGVYDGVSQPVPDDPVDLNSASEADLKALPGIGKARALAVLAYRRDNGPFAAVSDLGRVPGFSRALVARLAPRLAAR
jgi:competence ComEA-like helix-hairpin-helix protein